jgi:UDP-N-acetylmuramate dehydrogenase
MEIRENVSLKKMNTFGIGVSARYYVRIDSVGALQELFTRDILLDYPHMILGGGSNILFTKDYPGVIIHICMQGIELLEPPPAAHNELRSETIEQQHVFVKAHAGESWDKLVAFCVSNDWGGLENLSLIPGQVGTSPIQNIGAYGSELKDCFHSLEAMEKRSGEMHTFSWEDCQFGYRNSVFKRKLKDRFVIASVVFRLSKTNHCINTGYGAIRAELEAMGVSAPGIADVRQAVINIRSSKLPDPDVLGNAGSFFKNPVISKMHYLELQKIHPDMIAYPDTHGMKLAAGWLIERAGWKGFRRGNTGVHQNQALVLVNHGDAEGQEILALSWDISASVKQLFGIDLEPEVNIL